MPSDQNAPGGGIGRIPIRILALLLLVAVQVSSAAAQNARLFTPVSESRAELLSSQSQAIQQIRSQKTTRGLTLVRIDLEALQQPSVEMRLRGDVTSRAITQQIDRRSETDFTWYGELSDAPGQAILVVKGEIVVGTIRRDKELYKIRTVGEGLHAVIEIDESAFPQDDTPSFQEKERQTPAAPLPKRGTQDSTLSSRTPVIEVLVAYTAAAETAQGGAAQVEALIQLAVDETNQSYRNSRINAQVHLARTNKVTYDETGRTYDEVVSHLAGTNDGFMDDIHTLRNTFAADAVMLIIDLAGSCGLANDIMATPATAFAIVQHDCATGNYSFGHELGHLQGARHNQQVDPTTTPFAYGHGFQNGSSWRTVMAYDCTPSCSRLQYWSNPDVSFGGVPMGTVGTNNNARVLNTTAATVATFRNPNGAIWRYTGVPCSGNSCTGWQMLDNNPKSVAIIAAGLALYQLHNDGRIWRYTGTPCSGNSCPGWQMLDNNSKTVDVVTDGTALYQLHNDGRIWRYTGTPCSGNSCPGWQLLDNNSKTKAITASGGALYQLHNDGLIWRYTGTPCSGNSCSGWQLLDNNSRTTAIVSDGTALYQLHNNGRIWSYTGTPCSGNSCLGWQMLDNNPKAKAIAAAGGALYQLHNDGMIWNYTGTPCSGNSCLGWQMLDNNSRTVGFTASGSALYQLHNDGRVWRYTGVACSGSSCPGWQLLDNNSRTRAIEAGASLYQLHVN
ncbi:MAG TPA: M12 family metallo-peptidase [Blastocatellia bacterium]|nr:M12 family metallo-peptidase [Blastocatellia bacterium]